MNDNEPQSPCISVCVLDDKGICMGCYRSAEEVADWLMSDAAGKQAILERAEARRNGDSQVQ